VTACAYATKAFLCRAMAQLAHQEGMCLDVSTGGELHVALRAGVAPERLVLHGNNKSAAELARAIEVGVGRIIVDSFDEIDRLRVLSVEAPAPPKVLVRVTPGVEAHTHEFVRTGHEDTKFGFSIASGAAWRAVEELRSLTGVDLAGIHAHIGSQVFDVSSFEQAAEILGASSPRSVSTSCALAAASGRVRERGVGPSQAEWAEAVRAACRAEGVAPTTRITAEPGRSIVAGAGDHPLSGRHRQGAHGLAHLRGGRRRHERQPAARALRQRLRGVLAPGGQRRAPPRRAGGGQALRDRRHRRA